MERKRKWGFCGGFDTPMHTMPYVYVYFLNIFLLFFINKYVFFSFSFLFCDEIPDIHSRILTNEKPEWVIRNCQWNCMCNSSVIKIRWLKKRHIWTLHYFSAVVTFKTKENWQISSNKYCMLILQQIKKLRKTLFIVLKIFKFLYSPHRFFFPLSAIA